jgi:hypothetical protein
MAREIPRGTLIPVAPIKRLIEQWSEKELDLREVLGPRGAGNALGNLGKIAELTGFSASYIKDLRAGRTEWIEFDNADKIVCALFGPLLWHDDDELNTLYQDFDFGPLDTKKPCGAAA